MFLFTNSAKELWDKIKETYGQQNNYSYIYRLKQEIFQAKQGNKSTTEYLLELTAKFNELAKYLPPTTNAREIEKRQEQDKVYIYLGGLDSSFEAVRSQILLSTELPTFATVVAMVQREDARRTAMSTEPSASHQATENHAFAVGNSTSGAERGKNKREKCTHCKRNGHTHEKCWILHPHLKPKWKGESGALGQEEVARKPYRTLDGRNEERRVFVAQEESGASYNTEGS